WITSWMSLRTGTGVATVWHLSTRVRFPPPPLVSRRPALASSTCSPGRLVLFGVKSSLCDQGAERGDAFFAPPLARSGCHVSVAPTNHATLRAVTPRLPLLPRCTPNDARNA